MWSATAAGNSIANVVWRLSELGAMLAVVLGRVNVIAVIAGAGVRIHKRRALQVVPAPTLARNIGELDARDFLLKTFLDVSFNLHAAYSLVRLGRYACRRDSCGERGTQENDMSLSLSLARDH